MSSIKDHTITIIGCGWLGLPLGQTLVQDGYQVKGSTTSPDKLPQLQLLGIEPILLSLNPHLENSISLSFFESEVLIINIPPGLRHKPPSFHIEQIEALKEHIEEAGVTKVIYVSATSVYPETGDNLSESTRLSQENTGNLALLKAEGILSSSNQFKTTILRLGGLLGYNRVPGRYFEGKSEVEGHSRVNYIHRDDAIGFIKHIIKHQLWGETFNVIAPIARKRQEVFNKNVQDFSLKAISYAEQADPARIIGCAKIQRSGYHFKYPDPLDFYYQH